MGKDIVATLAIQSFCFRGFKEHAKVIEGLKASGASNLELCPLHFDPVEDPDHAGVLKTYSDAGIGIPVFGVHFFDENEGAARKVFEFAQTGGFATIGADFNDQGLAVAEKLCEKYGKKVAVHNHGRKHRFGPVAALEDLFNRSSANIGLCLDTAWMLDSGEDPLKVAQKFKDRLYGIHIKDFVFDPRGKPVDVIVGSGNLDLVGLAAFLTDIGFDGYLTLEYEGDVDNPVPALAQCVEAIQAAFAKA